MNFKKTNAETTTSTKDLRALEAQTGNIYKTINILSKRSNQIATEMKQELTSKIEEFSSHTDNLDEIFENHEQIEISKFYERLPKPTLIALQEFLENKIYFRDTTDEEEQSN